MPYLLIKQRRYGVPVVLQKSVGTQLWARYETLAKLFAQTLADGLSNVNPYGFDTFLPMCFVYTGEINVFKSIPFQRELRRMTFIRYFLFFFFIANPLLSILNV